MMEEFLSKGIPESVEVHHLKKFEEIDKHPGCYACFDLMFELSAERLRTYERLFPTVFIVNCVHLTHKQLHKIAEGSPVQAKLLNTVRVNAWPTFLSRNIIEVAGSPVELYKVFDDLDWPYKIVPDEPGFISARVIAMIINEAFFALGEGVSTKKEIDTAMKLGTNYPYGPFEWCDKIGIKNIYTLLSELSKANPRYKPAVLLEKETLA